MSTITEDLKNLLISIRKDKLKLILFLFLLANLIFLITWRIIDTRPPTWDPATHLTSTVIYYTLLSSGNLNPLIWLKVDQYYPPLYTISAIPFYAIFHNADGAVLVNFIYFCILVISTYLITLEIVKDRKYATLAGILVGVIPAILNLELGFMLDLPLASLVALSMYFLIKSEGFSDKKYGILFGFAFGAAMLTKWSAFVFVIPPALYLLIVNLKRDNNYKNKEFLINLGKNILYCFVAFSVIALPWYLFNLKVVISSLFYFGYNVAKVEGNPNPISLASAAYYPHIMLLQDLPEYLMLIFSIIVLFFINKKETLDEKEASILLWIFASLFILTFILRNKKARYILPLYSGIVTLFFISLKKLEVSEIKDTIKKYISYIPYVFLGISLISCVYCVPKPLHQNWHADDIIRTIAKDVKKHPELIYNDGRVVIAELQPCPYINGRTLQYLALRDNYPFVVLNVAYITPIESMNNTQLAKLFSIFDYVIYKTGPYRTPWKFIVDKAVKFFDRYELPYYTPIANYTLPNGETIIIYRRNI